MMVKESGGWLSEAWRVVGQLSVARLGPWGARGKRVARARARRAVESRRTISHGRAYVASRSLQVVAPLSAASACVRHGGDDMVGRGGGNCGNVAVYRALVRRERQALARGGVGEVAREGAGERRSRGRAVGVRNWLVQQVLCVERRPRVLLGDGLVLHALTVEGVDNLASKTQVRGDWDGENHESAHQNCELDEASAEAGAGQQQTSQQAPADQFEFDLCKTGAGGGVDCSMRADFHARVNAARRAADSTGYARAPPSSEKEVRGGAGSLVGGNRVVSKGARIWRAVVTVFGC